MSNYTKISLDDAEAILSLYNLKEEDGSPVVIQELIPLSLGISNSNYKVRTFKSVLLLKISNDKNESDLSKEMSILERLAELKFPYSLTPFQTTNKKMVYRCQHWYGVLFPFIEGIPPGPNDATCFEIGAALGLLHQISSKAVTTGIRPHEEVGFGPQKILEYKKSANCPTDFKTSLQHLLPNLEEQFLLNKFPTGIIHGDLYYDNTLFDLNRLKVLLDFEQAGVGEFILDIGISISGTCLEKGLANPMLIHSYLRGYMTARQLTSAEKQVMKEAIILGYFSISLWRIKRFKEGNLNPALRESYRDLIDKAEYFNKYVAPEIFF